jgi:hypothetical protein
MNALQKALLAAFAIVGGATIYEARQAAHLRQKLHALELRQAPLAEKLQQLEGERDAATNRLVALAQETAAAREVPAELLKLRRQVAALREQLQAATNASRRAPGASGALRQEEAVPNAPSVDTNQVLSAKAVIFSTTAEVTQKLEALRLLRGANARSDDVVKQMIQVYHSTENPKWRADVFRQLSGVTTPELKPPLVEALRDTTQNTEIRQEAAETLAHYLPDSDAKAWLDHVIANDPNEQVRAEASRRLERWQRHQAR